MRIAVIGATGFVGSSIVNELANRNHSIKAFARDTTKLVDRKNVVGVNIDVNNVDRLAIELKGADVVVSAFNPGWTNPNIYADYMKGAANIEKAVKQAGIKRFIVIGGAGSLFIDLEKQLQIVDTPNFPEEIKAGATAARDYLNEIKKEKELDWVYFSPALEMHPDTSGKRTGVFRLGTESPVMDKDMRSILSVEDLAVAIANEIETPAHHQTRFTAAY